MNISDFYRAIEAGQNPPAELTAAQVSLFLDGKDDWTGAHDALQHDNTLEGAWVHAYLHRKEGDFPNAAYWYRRAGQPVATGDLRAEWNAIVTALVG